MNNSSLFLVKYISGQETEQEMTLRKTSRVINTHVYVQHWFILKFQRNAKQSGKRHFHFIYRHIIVMTDNSNNNLWQTCNFLPLFKLSIDVFFESYKYLISNFEPKVEIEIMKSQNSPTKLDLISSWPAALLKNEDHTTTLPSWGPFYWLTHKS